MRSTIRQHSDMVESQDTTFDPKPFMMPGLTEKDIYQLKEVYDTFDTDGDGFLNPLDIRSAMTKFGYPAKKNTASHIVSQYDQEGEGTMNFKDFVAMCSMNHNQKQEKKSELRMIFLRFDKLKRGSIDIDDLKVMANELGENISAEVLEEMVTSVDGNMDGLITFDDFYIAMTKRIF